MTPIEQQSDQIVAQLEAIVDRHRLRLRAVIPDGNPDDVILASLARLLVREQLCRMSTPTRERPTECAAYRAIYELAAGPLIGEVSRELAR